MHRDRCRNLPNQHKLAGAHTPQPQAVPVPEQSYTPGSYGNQLFGQRALRLPPPCFAVASSLPRGLISRPFILCASGMCETETEEGDNQGRVGGTRRSRHVTPHSGSGVALTDTASPRIRAQERAHAGMHHGAAPASTPP